MNMQIPNPYRVHSQVSSSHPWHLLLVPTILALLLLNGQPAHADSHTVLTFGGPSGDFAHDIALDTDGNIYLLGEFRGTVDFDPGPDTVEKTVALNNALFVASYTPDGTLRFVIVIENEDLIEGRAITVDSAGNFYITGRFEGTADFDPGAETHLLNAHANGINDVYVASYSQTGSLIYALSYGAPQGDFANDIVVDAAGDVYVTGTVLSVSNESVDFDPGSGEAIHTPNGYDSYVVSYDENGEFRNVFVFGGTTPLNDAHATSLFLGQDGTLYIGGYFEGMVDFDPGAGVEERTSQNEFDVFVAAYEAANGQLKSVFTFGGEENVFINNIALSGSGILSLGGQYEGTVDFDPGPGTETRSGGGTYLASYTTNGALRFVHTWDVRTLHMAVDGAGNHFVTGTFNSTVDFDPGSDTVELTAIGDKTYVASYDRDGTFCSAAMLGGGPSEGRTIALEQTGNAYVGGSFQRTVDFDPSEGIDERTSNGFGDIYVVEFPKVCTSLPDPKPTPEGVRILLPFLNR